MSIEGQTFFEARKHVGSDTFILYVHEDRDAPRERKEFPTKEAMLTYLNEFTLSVSPEQLVTHLTGPPQKGNNPPGTKLIFTGRRKSESKTR